MTDREILDKMVFTSNFVFVRILQDEQLCKELLELILNFKISRVKLHETEKQSRDEYNVRGVRFDVYVEGDNKVYDIEMQCHDEYNIKKRARFYSGRVDALNLQTGMDFSELRDSYVIFLCTFDALKYGLPVYTIKRTIQELGTVDNYDDGSNIVIVNAKYNQARRYSVSPALLELLDFMRNPVNSHEVSTPVVRNIAIAVERLRTDFVAKEEFIMWYETEETRRKSAYRAGKLEGIEEGKESERKRLIELAFTSGCPASVIQSMFHLTPTEFKIYHEEYGHESDCEGRPYPKEMHLSES